MESQDTNKKKPVSIARNLWQSYVKAIKSYYEKLKPLPEDNIFTRLGKYLGLFFVVLSSILLSPVMLVAVILILILAL